MQMYTLPVNDSRLKCYVSPVVVMSILNYHQRRDSNMEQWMQTGFTVGLLFGKKRNNDIYINDCVPIPCVYTKPEPDSDEDGIDDEPSDYNISLELKTCEKFLKLFKLTEPQYQLVGWFKTGLDINHYSKTMHSHFLGAAQEYYTNPKSIVEKTRTTTIKEETNKNNEPKNNSSSNINDSKNDTSNINATNNIISNEYVTGSDFIHLMVDTHLTNNEMNIKAFIETSWTNPSLVHRYALQQTRINKAQTQSKKSGKKRKKKSKQTATPTAAAAAATTTVTTDGNNANNAAEAGATKTATDAPGAAAAVSAAQGAQAAKQNANNNISEKKQEDDKPIDKPTALFSRFVEIPLEYHATPQEKKGIDAIINSPADDDITLDAPAYLLNDIQDLEYTLVDLNEKLAAVSNYVNAVRSGRIEGNEDIGWTIAEAVATVPSISPEKFEKCLTNRLQDLLMIAYLGKLTKAQLTVADKINKVLYKTVPKYEG